MAGMPRIVALGLDAQNAAEHQGRREQRHADVDHQGREDRDHRQPVAAVAVVAAFEEVGQRRHPRPQVERGEKQRQQDQHEAGHPLEIAEDQAVLVGRLGEAHQVDGRDVGGEHGQADDRPAEGIAGQEVVAPLAAGHGLAAAAADPPGHAPQCHHGDQVAQDQAEIEPGDLQRHGAVSTSRQDWPSSLPPRSPRVKSSRTCRARSKNDAREARGEQPPLRPPERTVRQCKLRPRQRQQTLR